MTRSELEPDFLKAGPCCQVRLGLVACGGRLRKAFWVCLRNRVRLVECGSGWIQVKGL